MLITNKRMRKLLVLLPFLLLAYLAIAAAWAWSITDQATQEIVRSERIALSPRQVEILLKIEDPTFLTHHGVSLADGQGMATISSALARDVFLTRAELGGVKGALQSFYRAVFNCCRQVDLGRDVMAMVLNAKVSKDRQLSMYVTDVYMGTHEGTPVRGLHNAALVYMELPLPLLDDAQFMRLVAMIKAPKLYHPLHNREALDERARRVAAVVSGACRPAGWFDTTYDACHS